MTSTDDEHELEPKNGPAWRRYEKDVRELLDRMDDSTVTHNVKRIGALSKVPRQIDIFVERQVVHTTITIAVECKHYAKPLGIGMIDEFVGKIEDLQVSHGILYALNGLTGGARARADGARSKIEVRDLAPNSPPPPSWDEYIAEVMKFGDCGNPTCPDGNVDWQEWPQLEADPVSAGSCPMCGVWSVSCECGEITCFVGYEEKCVACGRVYELERSRDGEAEGIAITAGPVD